MKINGKEMKVVYQAAGSELRFGYALPGSISDLFLLTESVAKQQGVPLSDVTLRFVEG